ncbi:Potassium voltage-gated channel subfamily D member 2 [Sorochytrium milnesiophthora]
MPPQAEHTDMHEVVTVDVGGTQFKTYWSTLLGRSHSPETLFHALYKTSNNGTLFIDRDPEVFASLLRYLRTGHAEVPKSISLRAYVDEVEDYYGFNLPKSVKTALSFPVVLCVHVYEVQKYSYERGIQMRRELRIGKWEPANFPLVDMLRKHDMLHTAADEAARSPSPVHSPLFAGLVAPGFDELHVPATAAAATTTATATEPAAPTPLLVPDAQSTPPATPGGSSSSSASRPGREVITALLNIGYRLENTLLLGQTMYPLRSPNSFSNTATGMVDKGLFSQMAVFRRSS